MDVKESVLVSKHDELQPLKKMKPRRPLMEVAPATVEERDGLRAEYMTCEVLSRDFAAAQTRMRDKRLKILIDRGIPQEEALANLGQNQPLWDVDFMGTGRIRRAAPMDISQPAKPMEEPKTAEPAKPSTQPER